ncbi:hypothetical protein [Flavihumibacter fluvii]|uniref:hypothetical protein n=1 Tax=Flavihumibacter fluvii TaxID=2838157 RepID=UPI001BDF0828|nr:hypothetical protein [Flavihumibacter fluvii]ULQ52721.1 hypothetical protein KJS93_00095 [Flavihumibacter fluvii]
MKSTKVPLLVGAIIICTLWSCAKQSATLNNEEALVGKWTWVSTDGGIANHIHDTPNSTGKIIEWEINANQTYFIYLNGMIQSKGTYHLTKDKSIKDGEDKSVINFSGGQAYMVLQVNKTSLEVTDNYIDGTSSVFSKATIKN